MSGEKRYVLAVVGVWGALWAASVPFQPPEFRPWERLYQEDVRRFQASARVEMTAIGDLGYKTWVESLQHRRPTRFSTDRWGYRNAHDVEAPRVVVIGDSYVAGSGLSDDETVTARLERYLGEPVYNFATQHLNGPALFFRERRFAVERPEVVVYAPVARAIRPRSLQVGDPVRKRGPLALHREIGECVARTAERINEDNRLVRRSRYALQGLLYRWRGHPQEIVTHEGDRVLVLGLAEQGLLVPPAVRGLDQTVQMVVALDRTFRAAGVRFVFSPVPESGSIYPELFPESEGRLLASPPFLETLVERVREEGVEVVDLTRVFRSHRTPYLYLPDDSHWNPRAVDLAARALAERIAGGERLAVGGR